jgi:hypothetical protein
MEKEAPIAEAGHGIAIVVGPVEFPRILERPQIVLPFQPQVGQAYDGIRLGVHFLLGNVVARKDYP